MRVETLSQSKGVARQPTHRLPRRGSRARAIYDLLYEHRGQIAPPDKWKRTISSIARLQRAMADLRDYYGCDIRCVKQGRYPEMILAGEYIGEEYRDYVAEREVRK